MITRGMYRRSDNVLCLVLDSVSHCNTRENSVRYIPLVGNFNEEYIEVSQFNRYFQMIYVAEDRLWYTRLNLLPEWSEYHE